MRAVYDRVTSDTRRPLIPDLPFEELAKRSRREFEEDGSGAILAIAAIFGMLLLVAIGLGFYSSGTIRAASATVGSVQVVHGAD
jgi:hypothetical protein